MATFSNTGGFEYQFVSSPPNRVMCKICYFPSRDPELTMCCGHVFCESCLDSMKKAKSIVNNICPVCRSEDFVTFPNKQIDREVKSLQVYCTNKGRGCEWQGEINYIDNHLTKDGGCEYEDVLCTSGCGGAIQRRDLPKHVEIECPHRKVDCQYCQLRGELQFIEGQHKEECVEYPLACPNKCGEAECISRKAMNEHRSICPLEVINCEYQTMGCEVRMTRQTQMEHNKEKMEYHLYLTKCKLDETNRELSESNSRLDEVNSKFQVTNTESNARLDVAMKELSRTKEELSNVKSDFAGRILALEVLLHQKKSSSTLSASASAPVHNWSKHLHSSAKLSSSLHSEQTAPVTFKITGVSKKMKTLKDWQSNHFFTHHKGYSIHLTVYVAGNGECEGTHCSVFICLARGKYDDYLIWPFVVMLKVMFLNQISDREHWSGSIDFGEATHINRVTHRLIDKDIAESGWGVHDFISHGDLTKVTHTCQFIKDDCIFVRVCL